MCPRGAWRCFGGVLEVPGGAWRCSGGFSGALEVPGGAWRMEVPGGGMLLQDAELSI